MGKSDLMSLSTLLNRDVNLRFSTGTWRNPILSQYHLLTMMMLMRLMRKLRSKMRKMRTKRRKRLKKRRMSLSQLKKVTNQRKRRTRRRIRSIRKANMVIMDLTKAITRLKKLSKSNLTWMLGSENTRMSTIKCMVMNMSLMQIVTTTMINSGLTMTLLTISHTMITRQIIGYILSSPKITLTMMDTMRKFLRENMT